MFRLIFRYFWSPVGVLTTAIVLSSCVQHAKPGDPPPLPPPKEVDLVIPDFPTAKQQYEFASAYQKAQVISPEKKRRAVQLDKLMQCYNRVIQNFQSDTVYTPLSRLAIADCYSNLGEWSRAMQLYSGVMRDYPQNEFVQARGMFSIGKVYDRTNEHQKAKDTYRQVMERFAHSDNTTIQQIVKQSEDFYYRVQEQPKSSRRK